jgi:hypothetical protein
MTSSQRRNPVEYLLVEHTRVLLASLAKLPDCNDDATGSILPSVTWSNLKIKAEKDAEHTVSSIHHITLSITKLVAQDTPATRLTREETRSLRMM